MFATDKQKARNAQGLKALNIILDAVKRGLIRVDPDGSIWATTFRGKPCKPFRTESPVGQYLKVYFVVEGVQYKVQAHRLVWTVLRGEIPLGLEINHIDGDGTNNHPDNLEVVDTSGNQRHRRDVLGKGNPPPPRHVGEGHPMAKLDWEKVREMRRLYGQGHGVSDLMRRFNLKHSQTTRIVKNQSWVE